MKNKLFPTTFFAAALGAVFSLAASAADSSGDPDGAPAPAATEAGGSVLTTPAVAAVGVPPSLADNTLDERTRNETLGLLRDGDRSPFVNDRAETIADIQTVQAVRTADSNDRANRFITEVPVASGGGVVSAAAGRTEFLGERPGLDPAGTRSFPSAPGAPGSAASATALLPAAAPGAAATAPLVSTEGQVLSAGAARPAAAGPVLDSAVGRLVDVDPPRGEITVNDQFSGRNVTLSVSPALIDDLEEGAVVKAQYEPRTLRAEAVLVQRESQR